MRHIKWKTPSPKLKREREVWTAKKNIDGC